MDKRFTELRPQIADIKYGPEPSLYNLVVKYYESYNCTVETADSLAKEYISKWVELENNNA